MVRNTKADKMASRVWPTGGQWLTGPIKWGAGSGWENRYRTRVKEKAHSGEQQHKVLRRQITQVNYQNMVGNQVVENEGYGRTTEVRRLTKIFVSVWAKFQRNDKKKVSPLLCSLGEWIAMCIACYSEVVL